MLYSVVSKGDIYFPLEVNRSKRKWDSLSPKNEFKLGHLQAVNGPVSSIVIFFYFNIDFMPKGKCPKTFFSDKCVLTIPVISYFCPKHKDLKIFENHLNLVTLGFIG